MMTANQEHKNSDIESCCSQESGQNDKVSDKIDNGKDIPLKSVVRHGYGFSNPKISNNETILHILKGNIGPAILAMPEAFKNAGITVGTVGLAFVALMCVHCMHLLLKCSTRLCEKTGVTSMDYATIAESSFTQGPKKFRKLGKFIRHMTNVVICVTQFGYCTVYFTFVSQNIEATVQNYRGDTLDYRIIMCFLLILFIPLNLIRNLKYLAPAALFANLLLITSLIIIFTYLFTDVPPMMTVEQFGTWKGIPLFFGTAVFTFEGIALIMPVENSMRDPKAFRGLTGVLNTCMVWMVCLYTAMGFYGYLKYGEDIKSSITLNLPEEALADVVRIFYAASVCINYAIQFYVPISVMWPAVVEKYHLDRRSSTVSFALEALFRIFFILITFVLGAAIPQFSNIISLIGSVGGAYLSLILPAAMELATFWDSEVTWITIIKDGFISIIGIIGLVTGLYSTIIAIQDSH